MKHVTKPLESAAKGDVADELDPSLAGQDLLELLNRGYVCPPDAGPAWKAAFEAGVDMGLVEDALRMNPGERLREHQRALNLVLALAQSRSLHDAGG